MNLKDYLSDMTNILKNYNTFLYLASVYILINKTT